jgi:hypothetical protein
MLRISGDHTRPERLVPDRRRGIPRDAQKPGRSFEVPIDGQPDDPEGVARTDLAWQL